MGPGNRAAPPALPVASPAAAPNAAANAAVPRAPSLIDLLASLSANPGDNAAARALREGTTGTGTTDAVRELAGLDDARACIILRI